MSVEALYERWGTYGSFGGTMLFRMATVLNSNHNFAQDILIPNAKLDSDVEAVAYNR